MERWQLISEFIAYLEDEGLRPFITIQTQLPGTCGLPPQYIKSTGHIALNISDSATNGSLRVGMYQCECNMRFGDELCATAWHPDAIESVFSPDGGPKLLFPAPDLSANTVVKPKLSIVKE